MKMLMPLKLFILLVKYMTSMGTIQPVHFNPYHTQISTTDVQSYMCLYYYAQNDFYDEWTNIFVQQIIEYCFRPSSSLSDLPLPISITNDVDDKFFFKNLTDQSVSIEQLFSWSASIDLIETYQMYLTDPITYSSFSEKIFYNCTEPWFGEFCEYAFDESYMPLKDIVRYIFNRYRFNDHTESSNLTCYIHLPSCNRGLALLCLDWREICNGKFDCIDSKIDEEYCFELDENECADDEYRCHTRGQCIPKVFLRDDPLNPDCLDRSDENLFLELYPNSCAADPEFRCEEHTCQPSMFMEFECGDGQCAYDYGHCRNRRAHLFQEALTGLRPNGINFTCWAAMVCVTRIADHYENISCNTYFPNLTITIRENCPSLFQFPSMPVLFGHIHFLYTNYQPELQKADEVIRPDYVCYNEELCPLSQVTSEHLHGLTCQSFDSLYGNQSFRSWSELVELLTASFYGCSTAGLELRQCENRNSTKWYRCANSTKCISIHRLVDGLVDCYAKDDETYIDSCSLSDSKHRFKCFYEDKCLAPILLSHAEDECYNQSGSISSPSEEQLFSFTILCNGFTELSSQLIDNQQYNDETECDYWPCNNIGLSTKFCRFFLKSCRITKKVLEVSILRVYI